MLSDWVKDALDFSGMSGAELARRLSSRVGRSIDRAAVNKILKGLRRVSADEMVAISDITGFPAPTSPPTVTVSVPHVSWVSAGAFREVGQLMPTDEFPAIEVSGLPPGDWFALTVDGDSMDRISPPGSIILVNRRDRKIVPNACYVIANEQGEATYKRYRPSPERFEPVSVRSDIDPIFPDGAVTVIGRVRRSILEM